jgi:glycosyltransferase involved in cell wall biosynthesis
MRILYFSKTYSTHDHRFLASISGGGHEVFFLRLEGGSRQVEDRPVPSQVRQVQWAGGRGPFRWRDAPRLVLDLKRVIRRLQPDLVHAGPIQTCAFIAALTGFRPLLTMSWGFDLMEDVHRNRWWDWATRYTLKRSTFFTSDAIVTREKAVAYGMRPERTVVFPWGVDLGHFNVRTFTRSNDQAFTLFCNRAWEPRYGVDVLARAFVQVARQRQDVNLILLNGGSQAQAIRQILMSGDALDRVTFGGQISQTDLPNWYHMADLYISPSHVDGSSVSLMEALACGLPALVSDIPANREWVTDGENGWLFPDGDSDALAGKIVAAIAQRRKWPGIGRAARRSAQERADWKKNVRMLLDAYQQAVEHNRR